ncbi:MAG: hypothetical protein ACT4TC_26830 [Myxococcaceae bacterium]
MTRWSGSYLGWLAIFAVACSGEQTLPGDQAMGSFSFVATRRTPGPNTGCSGYPELELGSFDFEATFSRQRDTGEAWMSAKGVVRGVVFDGQFLEGTASGVRRLKPCGDCTAIDVNVTETFRVALLSRSQAQAVGSTCPPPLTSVPVDVDAGIVAPSATPLGFDATRACGELMDTFTCGVESYDLVGVRK